MQSKFKRDGVPTTRESRLSRIVSGALGDLRHSLRLLARSPGFTSVALLTLALCLGANAAIFSLVYGLILKPLPFSEPERIVEIFNTYKKTGPSRAASNIEQYLDYRENARSYESLGLWLALPALFGEEATAQRLWSARATPDMFEVFRLRPVIGRFFTTEHSRPNEDRVVVLTQSFWESHYREDPGVIGKSATIDGATSTIIGVAPRALEALDGRVRFVRPIFWTPGRRNPALRYTHALQLCGRLKPGVSAGQAFAEADTLERRAYDNAPPELRTYADRTGHRIGVGGLQAERVAPLKTSLYLLQAGAILVLFIGWVNVTNLLLARANGRQSELAIRFALGASRGAVARQLLTESLVLTLAGAMLGLGLAWGAVSQINRHLAQILPTTPPVALDARVLGFAAGASLLVGMLMGALPAIHVLRENLIGLINRRPHFASGSAGVRTWSSILIIGQVAIAFVLLTGAGLLIHSFARAVAVNPGFDSGGVVTGRIALPLAYRRTNEAARGIQERVVQGLQEIAGVESAGFSFAAPFQRGVPLNAFHLAEDTLPPGTAQPSAYRVVVSPGYARTLRLPLREGRFFEAADLAPGARPVFVVDETFANSYFPGRSAIEGRFAFGGRPAKESGWPAIVGVVGAVPHNGVEDRSGIPFVYQLMSSASDRPDGLILFMRTSLPVPEAIRRMRQTIQAIDPMIALFDTASLQSLVDASFGNRRAVMLLLSAFAGLALFLSALGIYGVLAYDVSQRTREIGIRGAIGATRGQLGGLFLKQGMVKASLGLAAGLAGAAWLSRYMTTLLFEVKPTDPAAYAVVSILLLAVAALASYLPARRAARIDPLVALRAE
ncbi:MAG: ABC transporter permease [Verrucomicrobia bacterium]|nr:ABC transporter permease [Verrucomicrobiota bacterium]